MLLEDIEVNEKKEQINLFYFGLAAIIIPIVLVPIIFLIADSNLFGTDKKEVLETSFNSALVVILFLGVFLMFNGGLEVKITMLFAIVASGLVITSFLLRFCNAAIFSVIGGICVMISLRTAHSLQKQRIEKNDLYYFVLLIIMLSVVANILAALILDHTQVLNNLRGMCFPLG